VFLEGEGVQEMVRSAIQESEISVPGETGFGLKSSRALDGDLGGWAGGDLFRCPLSVRRRLLQAVIKPVENRLEIVQCQTVTSLDVNTRRSQLEAFFNTVTLAGEEGLMVKDLTSGYIIGKKAPKWVKMKPEYGDQTTDLDLVVIGG
jgi:ATP-dependent DNA ligase